MTFKSFYTHRNILDLPLRPINKHEIELRDRTPGCNEILLVLVPLGDLLKLTVREDQLLGIRDHPHLFKNDAYNLTSQVHPHVVSITKTRSLICDSLLAQKESYVLYY